MIYLCRTIRKFRIMKWLHLSRWFSSPIEERKYTKNVNSWFSQEYIHERITKRRISRLRRERVFKSSFPDKLESISECTLLDQSVSSSRHKFDKHIQHYCPRISCINYLSRRMEHSKTPEFLMEKIHLTTRLSQKVIPKRVWQVQHEEQVQSEDCTTKLAINEII